MIQTPSKGHSKYLRVLAIFFIFLPLVFFVIGFAQYWGAGYAEQRLGILKANEVWWVPFLFLLPIAAQVLTIYILDKESHRDSSVATFFLFCLRVMPMCPLGYCMLWSIYPVYGGQWFSIIALVVIFVLLGFVGLMTYAIIRGARTSSVLLSEDEVNNVIDLCEKLKNGHTAGYREVFSKLPSEVVEVVEGVITRTVPRGEETTQFVKVVNAHVLVSQEFHESLINTIHPQDSEISRLIMDRKDGSLTVEKLERGNRRILDHHLKEHVEKTTPHYLWRMEHFLNNLHEGVSKTPFWALMFFFTVFLGITYLFAFAFAFHDRSVKSTGRVPALYMDRNRPSGAVEEQGFAGQDASRAAVTWPDYVLHYTGNDTVPTVHSTQFEKADYKKLIRQKSDLEKEKETFTDEKTRLDEEKRSLDVQRSTLSILKGQQQASKDYAAARRTDEQLQHVSNDFAEREKKNTNELKRIDAALEKNERDLLEQNRHWKDSKNPAHFNNMIAAIVAETSYGEGIMIELKQPQPGSLFDERLWKLKYQMLMRLAEIRAIPSSISWVDLPKELPPVPPPPDARPRSELSLTDLLSDPRRARLVELVKTKVEESTSEPLEKQLEELSNAKSPDGQLTYANNQKLRGDLQRLLELVPSPDISQVEEKNFNRKLSHALTEFRETYESQELIFLDKIGNEEHISVSVKPLQERHHAIPLGLMDYVYFTVYTITTTGYGDIVPTTTYAKFLCTVANIIEVFFLVVFFNALLSVRSNRNTNFA